MWGKNIVDLNADEISRAQAILAKYNLRVTDIASPLFKVDWPGAPRSRYSSQHDNFAAETEFKKQDEVLAACIELAKQFKTDKIRCFDFCASTTLHRIAPPSTKSCAPPARLREEAGHHAGHRERAVLQHLECPRSRAHTRCRASPDAQLGPRQRRRYTANWTPSPPAGRSLPKDRIHHCHCKNTVRDTAGKMAWSPGRHRIYRLGCPVPCAEADRLSQRRLAGDALVPAAARPKPPAVSVGPG